MTILNIKKALLVLSFASIASISFSQNGTVTVNQDHKIEQLIALKKHINTSESATNRYKIQIYSGSRNHAESTEVKFKNAYNQWPSTMVYETPNYKIWVGDFRTRLEADRALMKIKEKFESAFIFKPKLKEQP